MRPTEVTVVVVPRDAGLIRRGRSRWITVVALHRTASVIVSCGSAGGRVGYGSAASALGGCFVTRIPVQCLLSLTPDAVPFVPGSHCPVVLPALSAHVYTTAASGQPADGQ
jgi:hypothetical protein